MLKQVFVAVMPKEGLAGISPSFGMKSAMTCIISDDNRVQFGVMQKESLARMVPAKASFGMTTKKS